MKLQTNAGVIDVPLSKALEYPMDTDATASGSEFVVALRYTLASGAMIAEAHRHEAVEADYKKLIAAVEHDRQMEGK